jgi:2-polyprenyl-3-methyl-5-hydroxy-6-metoxy-1,4-benzoquinol methylase
MVLNGKHRLAILLALGVQEFPVALCPENEVRAFFLGATDRAWPRGWYRKSFDAIANLGRPMTGKHAEIDALRRLIHASKLETWADVYHPIPFYEFRDLTTQVEPVAAYQRLGMILAEYPSLEGLRVLDLGANVGFYSFSLARKGAKATAVEVRPEYVEIGRRLADIYELPVDYVSEPVTPEWQGEYDLVLCFSMLQWVIAEHGLEFGKRLLRAISEKSRAMFFDVSVNVGKSCLRSRPGEELVFVDDLLRTATSYREVRYLDDVHPYGVDTRHVFFCQH